MGPAGAVQEMPHYLKQPWGEGGIIELTQRNMVSTVTFLSRWQGSSEATSMSHAILGLGSSQRPLSQEAMRAEILLTGNMQAWLEGSLELGHDCTLIL